MNNRGFSLVELLAVILVIAIIAAFALPRVLNQFSNYTGELSEKEKNMIMDGAKVYVDANRGSYLTNGSVCLNLQNLVNSGDLNEKFVSDTMGTNYNSKYSIEVTYNKTKDKHTYLLCESAGCTAGSCH